MRDISKEWIAYTNVRKQASERAKALEEAAKPISIHRISKSASVSFPALVGRPKAKPANVSYPVDKDRALKLADALGDINMTYRDLGLRTFDYTYSEMVGNE